MQIPLNLLTSPSCCPPNVHRLLAALPQYVYTSDAHGIQVNLFTDSTLRHTLAGGGSVRLVQTTRYPWEGIVRFGLELDERGNIRTDENCHTSVEGVFAAGDASQGASLVVRAIDAGRRAAAAIDQWLARPPERSR